MNKKLIFCSICGALSLVLVGCQSSSDASTIKNLSYQLDKVTNTVSEMSAQPFRSALSQRYYQSPPLSENVTGDKVYQQVTRTQAGVNEHEALKECLLSSAGYLKTCLKENTKLSNAQLSSLKSLTNDIARYVSNLDKTTGNISTSVKEIKKNRNSGVERLSTQYQILNNNLDTRICYMRNLLSSVEQAQNVLDKVDYTTYQNGYEPSHISYNNYYNISNTKDAKSTEKDSKTATDSNKESGLKKNIDTYKIGTISDTNYGSGYNNYYNNYNYNNGYNNPRYNGYYGQYYNGYGMPYGAYGNGYFYGNRGMFNPNRNTDTYRPTNYNIDTYRAPIAQEVSRVDNETDKQTNEKDKTSSQTSKNNANQATKNEGFSTLENKHPMQSGVRIAKPEPHLEDKAPQSRLLPNERREDKPQKVIKLPIPQNGDKVNVPRQPKNGLQEDKPTAPVLDVNKNLERLIKG